jgi:peptide deformylase
MFRKKNGFGRAIADPQVGASLRFIVINIDSPKTLFNPEITYRSNDTFSMRDNCLIYKRKWVRLLLGESASKFVGINAA